MASSRGTEDEVIMTIHLQPVTKLNCFPGAVNESTSAKRYFPKAGNVAFTCRHFGISRETYYQWKWAFAAHGEKGLINTKPCPETPKLHTPLTIEEKILYLRRTYHFGQVNQLVSGSLSRHQDLFRWGIQRIEAPWPQSPA